ncbi:MAG: CHASE4 domain-containing protein [Arenimonas sp.]
MKLRTRTLLIVLALVGLVLLSAEMSVRWLIYPRFAQLEREQARASAEQVVEFLNHEFETLAGKPEDWGYWDGTYDYVVSHSPDYEESNLGVRSQQSLRVNLLGFYDRAGRKVWARGLDLQTLEPFPLAQYTDAGLDAESQFLAHEDAPRVRVGLVDSERGPILVASTPILSSLREGPSRGTLVMGRFFDPDAVRRIARQGALKLILRPHRGASPPPPAIDPMQLRLYHSAFVQRVTDDTVWVSTVVFSVEGEPTLDIAVGTPRRTSQIGVRALRDASLAVGIAGVLITALLLFLLNQSVIRPILAITRHVGRIGGQDDLGARIALQRDDEIGELAAEFDGMLARMAETRQRLFDQSYRAGANEMASGVIEDLRASLQPLREHVEQPLRLLDRSHTSGMQMLLQELGDPALSRHRFGEIVPMLQDQINEHAGLLAEARGELRGLRRDLERLQGIVTEYSRFVASPHELEAVTLSELVDHALRKLPDELRRGLVVDIDDSLAKSPPVEAARGILQQVLNVLLEHAARSAPNGRPVKLRMSAGRELVRGRSNVHLRLDDDRPALSADEIAELFEHEGTAGDDGSGLSLAWAASAIASMGGQLHAEGSPPFDGLVMHLVLPRAKPGVQ